MQQIINIIGPTIFAIALGYLLGRLSRANVGTLIDVAMFIATPCLVFNSLFTSEIQIGHALQQWATCLMVILGTFVIAWLVFGVFRKRGSAVYLPIMFSNAINIPVPILYLAFGDAGVAQAMLYYIPNGLLIYSLAVYVASGQRELRQGIRAVLRTPLIYAALLGLALNLAGASLPSVITNSLAFVGQAAVPLMLLILGVNVGRFKLRQIPLTVAASVIRMGGGFAIALLAVWLLDMTGLPRAVALFQSAMPSAIFVSVLATKYNNEAELVSSIVLMTTVLAIGVVPALLFYLT